MIRKILGVVLIVLATLLFFVAMEKPEMFPGPKPLKSLTLETTLGELLPTLAWTVEFLVIEGVLLFIGFSMIKERKESCSLSLENLTRPKNPEEKRRIQK